jgi:hypothetical protein
MNNLFDMIRNAQGGNGMENLASQFGLQQTQVQSALEALLPAFSMGLEKQAQNPAGMMNMFGQAAQGTFHNMFDHGASPAETQSAGNEVLGSLFGSKDMSRAVAAQASAASGISSTILKAMLPTIAAMLMGGVMKNMFNGQGGMLGGLLSSMFGGGQQAQPGAASGGGIGDILGQMMGGGQAQPGGGSSGGMGGLGDILGQMMGNKGAAAGAPSGGLGDILGQMMGGGQAASGAGGGMGGLGDILGQMMGGGQAQPGAQAANPMDMFGDMFKSGAKAQQTHVDGLQSIFDQFMGKR